MYNYYFFQRNSLLTVSKVLLRTKNKTETILLSTIDDVQSPSEICNTISHKYVFLNPVKSLKVHYERQVDWISFLTTISKTFS